MTLSLSAAEDDPLLRLPAPERAALAHIPGDFGLPLVGKTLPWIRDFFAFAEGMHHRYGPVSKTCFLGTDLLVVSGADNIQAAYLNSEEPVSARLAPSNPLSPFYAGALLFTDGSGHKGKRRFMQHAFKFQAMRGYVDAINTITAKHVELLPTERPEPVFPLMKNLLTEVAATIFFGLEMGDPIANTLMRDFVVMNQGLMSLVRTERNLPGFTFPKAMLAKQRIEAYFHSVIAERRGGEGNDVLSHLCRATDDDGNWIPDEEIVRQAKFLFFAAHDTTSSSMTNLLMFTGIDDTWQRKMREEIENVLGARTISYDDLDKLDTVLNVFYETLRHYPAVATSPRIAIDGCRLGGLDIPVGTPLALVPRTTHMDPAWWQAPEQFDPSRFAPPRGEHKGHPFQFAPFGGGAHKCIGMHFAIMVSKVFLSHLLRRYRYQLPADYPIRMNLMPLPKPKDELPMRFEPLT
ncbi:MAG: cytochrome P450 [Pseudomonadota bacterium]